MRNSIHVDLPNSIIYNSPIKQQIENNLKLLSLKYDKLYMKYYRMNVKVLILSAVITSINAFTFIFIESFNDNKYLNFASKLLSLTLSTIMTILTSVIRFRNYREKLEKLKQAIDTLHLSKSKIESDNQNNIQSHIKELNKINLYNYISISEIKSFTIELNTLSTPQPNN